MARGRLRPEDWVLAGLAALAEGGIEAVRVERLARALKTSKGSFYWHFADRPALLQAVLDRWEDEGTSDVIKTAEAVAEPAERLRLVARAALVPLEQGIDVARAEAALRAWAAEDPVVGRRLARVDARRVDFLAGELRRLGYAETAASEAGAAIYLTLLGLYTARGYAPALAQDRNLLSLIELVIAAAPGSRA